MSALQASNLLGKKIGRWQVLYKRIKSEGDDSGAFSSCYEVQDDYENLGFLKAFNIRYALSIVGNSMDRLKYLTERFTYERDLLIFCREKGMDRIVTAIDHGEYSEEQGDIPVPYLVFEIAKGSLKHIDFLQNPDLTWKLRAFHGTLVGVSQLHQEKIAHQDLKPSNILIFGKDCSKISDLGSAAKMNTGTPWNSPEDMLTDYRYAPIELLYKYFSPDWNTRRLGADLFMLGGLLSYMVTGTSVLSGMLNKIPEEQHWRHGQATFEEALPNIMMAFNQTLRDIQNAIPSAIRDELIEIIHQLSFPIPEQRGNPSRFRGRVAQYSLRRYISIIDRLANEYNILMR